MNKTKLALAAFVASWPVMISLSLAKTDEGNRQIVNREYQRAGATRKFSIEYVGKVLEIPSGAKKLRVWIPAPQSSVVQKIEQLEFTPKAQLAAESKYGNQVAYWEIETPASPLEVKMKFVCTREEIRMDLPRLKTDAKESSEASVVFRQPDRLVIVDNEIRKLAAEITAGKTATLEKARAIYDYVLNKMTYAKNHPGWGKRGSSEPTTPPPRWGGRGTFLPLRAQQDDLRQESSRLGHGQHAPRLRRGQGQLHGFSRAVQFVVPGRGNR